MPAAAFAAEPAGLSVYPPAVTIRGADDAPQLVVTDAGRGRPVDVTGAATYAVTNTKVIRVQADGRVLPIGNGAAEVSVTHGGKTVRVPVTVTATEAPLPINFPNQIEPVFTKLGCNSGGCHGKISGQNGFRLSLLGFEPEFDYDDAGEGEPRPPAVPGRPGPEPLAARRRPGWCRTAAGRRWSRRREEYKLLRRWIAAGLPYGAADRPDRDEGHACSPSPASIDRQGRQQLAVYAHYSDGTVEDVTRRAQYESNDTEVADRRARPGWCRRSRITGQAAVMVRYQRAT